MVSDRMTLVEAIDYIRNDKAHAAALAELQEVRAVLSLSADRRHPKHGHCWCRKDLTNDNEPHGEFCRRARVLMEKLRS